MPKRVLPPAALILFLLCYSPDARAGAGTVAGAATVEARSATWLAIETPFTGDDNGNGHTLYEIATSPSGPFGNPESGWRLISGPPEWRANVAYVSPSTTYYVRVTFFDPDGVAGPNPQTLGPVTTPPSSPNSVSAGAAAAVAGDMEISVRLPVADDANRNSGGYVEIATSASGPWTRVAGSPSEANLPFHPKRARLRGLTPGTDYWVRVTVTDPDGVTGANPQTLGPVHYGGLENLARGKPVSANAGWGCCPSPSQLVDGRIQYDAWPYGFAWTGGTTCWAGGCPAGLNKQATVDLGAPTEFSRVAMWHHDPSSVPVVWKIQTSDDGANFTDAYSNTDPVCRTATEQMPGAWYYPACAQEARFAPVTARYVRYLFDDSTLFGGLHGWSVEFEVFNDPCEPALTDTGQSIPVGPGPAQAALTPNGAELYVSNYGAGTVSVISTATNTVTANVPVGPNPDGLAVAPDGSKVYVGHQGGGVTVINTATKEITTVNTLGGPVRDLAITPDGSKVYLAMEFSGLKVINTSTLAVSTVSSVSCPEGVRVTPDGSTVYVNYQCGGPGGRGGHDAVGRFDAATGAFLGSTTGLPNVGSRLNISPDGAQVWEIGGDACSSPFYDHVGCPYVPAGVLNVLATSSNTLQRSIGFAGFGPGLVSFFPDSSRAVVGNAGTELLVFDTQTFNVVSTLAVAGSGSVAFHPNGTAYATVPDENRVAVLQLSCSGALFEPSFTNLSSPTITYGTPETTLSGAIGGDAGTPTGNVEITLDGVTLLAAVQPDGSFSATFGTATLGAGAHAVTYHYGGDASYTSADGAGTLTVTKAAPTLRVFGGTFSFDGQPHPATGTVTGVNGEELGAPAFTYNGSADAPVAVGTYAVSATYGGDANYLPASNDAASVYINAGPPPAGDVGTYWVAHLGTLGGPTSAATAVNAAGQAVGYSETSSGEIHAFLYAGGAMTDLGTLGGNYSVATAINSAGHVVGYSQTAGGQTHAFLYAAGAMTDLGTLGGADSFAYGINDNGQIVGEAQTASGDFHAFLYAAGSMTDLGTLPGGSYSAANSVNLSGQVVGYSQTSGGLEHAFLYTGGAMVDLGTLPGDAASAGASIGDGGQVVGYSAAATGSTHAFLYDGQMRDLGVLSPGADFSRAAAVSAGAEAVVGQSVTDAGDPHGFVFDGAQGMRSLNTLVPSPGSPLVTNASGVNSPGQIAATGDAGGQTVALLLTPVRATTTTVADASVTYSDAPQSVTLTATIAATHGATADEGTVTFQVRQGATDIGSPVTSAPLTNGIAAVSYSLPGGAGPGDYTIHATYNDGPKFTASSGEGSLTINEAATSTVVASSANPSAFGQTVTFTATVTAVAPGAGVPAGSVQFKDGATVLATVNLSGGSASFTTSALAVGSHPMTAVYGGHTNHTASTSPVLTQAVNRAATATSVTSSANPSVFGQSVTFTATVGVLAPGAGTPTGSVQFFDGATPLGTRPLTGSHAALTTSALTTGSHAVTAVYLGDASFNQSTSPARTQTVNPAFTTATLTGPGTSTVGQSVTFTVTVAPAAPGAGVPTGQVQFKINGANAPGGLKALADGQASYTTSSLSIGTHTITAAYAGDANFRPSSGSMTHRRR